MASSAPASSRSTRLLDALRRPSAFVSSNWAGLLAVASIVGVVPGLAGVTRVVTDLDRHADEGFVVPWRQVRATLRRDLPLSLTVVVATVMALADLWAVVHVAPATRVMVVGFLVPVLAAVCVFTAGYAVAASTLPFDADRGEVLALCARLLRRHPVRALLTPLLMLVLLPLLVLPPVTIAVGVSLPAWVIAAWWGVRESPEGPRAADT